MGQESLRQPSSRPPSVPPSAPPTAVPPTVLPMPMSPRSSVSALGDGAYPPASLPPGTPHRAPVTPAPGVAAPLSPEVQEVVERLEDLADKVEQDESRRDEEYRQREEERDRRFAEAEERRRQEALEAEERREQEIRERMEAAAAIPTTPRPASPSGTYTGSESMSTRQEEPLPTRPPGEHADPSTAAESSPVHTIPPTLPPQGDSASVTSHSTGHGIGPSQISSLRELFREEREAWFAEHKQALEDQKREREDFAAERSRQAEEREERIRALEDELASVKEELRQEKAAREADVREREEQESQERADREDAVLAQLGDITNLIQGQQQTHEDTRALLDEIRQSQTEFIETSELKGVEMTDRLADIEKNIVDMVDSALKDKDTILEAIGTSKAELIDTLHAEFDNFREDVNRQHAMTIEAVKQMAQEQVPFNVQGYLDEFSRALASEVRMLLGEVGKLREERRGLQHEISFLLGVKSKYIPGGEFEPDWKGPVGAPGMPPMGPAPDAGPPPPPPEVQPARPAWRTVSTRTSKKKKKDQMPAPPVAQPDPRQQVRSWATWQPDPNLAPSPSSFENPTLAAPAESPGLFGPRSPRSSRHLG
ncbi:hypothetical protein HDZ31DRAFT_62614 [Schizophyllum fasciatum]